MGSRWRLFVIGIAVLGATLPRPVRAQDAPPLLATVTAEPATVAAGQLVRVSYEAYATDNAAQTAFSSAGVFFGDGESVDGGSTGPGAPIIGSTVHTYSVPGVYNVRFNATTSDGVGVFALAKVTVLAAVERPSVTLQLSPASVIPGQPVIFSYSVTETQDLPAGWTLQIAYGDGPPVPIDPTAGSVSHTYAEPGTYMVLLGVTNASGETLAVTSGAVQVGTAEP